MDDQGLRRSKPSPSKAEKRSAHYTKAASGLPGLPAVWSPILGLFWLWCGLIFMKNAADFGFGFFPAMLWIFTFPLIAMFYVFMTIEKLWLLRRGEFGPRFRRWRMAFWVLAALVYGVVSSLHLLAAFGVCSSCVDALDAIVTHAAP